MKGRNKIAYGFGFLVLGAAFVTIMGLATMYLWNWLIPDLFNGGVIDFWQAIGLLLLGKLLTGFAGWGRRNHRGCYGKRAYWREKWNDKMKNMSPEERERFKSYYYNRCGYKHGWMNDDPEIKSEKEETAVQS